MLKGCFVGFVQYTIKRQILFYILASVSKGTIALLILFLNSVALHTIHIGVCGELTDRIRKRTDAVSTQDKDGVEEPVKFAQTINFPKNVQ